MNPTVSLVTQNPTDFPEPNIVLQQFVEQIVSILGDNIVGVYLHGSLALGDFNPHNSDLDFFVATRNLVTTDHFEALRQLHAHLKSQSKWGNELEGTYLPVADMKNYIMDDTFYPHRSRGGTLEMEKQGHDLLILLHTTLNAGITLWGSPPANWIDTISDAQVREAVLYTLHGWWGYLARNPQNLEYYGYRYYAIMTMCRIIYTLQFSRVISKPNAGIWAKQNIPKKWHTLIDQAMIWQDNPPPDNFDQTIAFIRYVLDWSRLEHLSHRTDLC